MNSLHSCNALQLRGIEIKNHQKVEAGVKFIIYFLRTLLHDNYLLANKSIKGRQ